MAPPDSPVTAWSVSTTSLCAVRSTESSTARLVAPRGLLTFTLPRMPASEPALDRKSTRLNSSHSQISYAVFCLKKKNKSCPCESVCPPEQRSLMRFYPQLPGPATADEPVPGCDRPLGRLAAPPRGLPCSPIRT